MSKQVARGVAKLNKHYPGWYRDVNPYWLDISSCYDCVIGQLYGSYHKVYWKLRLLPLTAGMYGFNHRVRGSIRTRMKLNHEWKDTILVLREAELAAERSAALVPARTRADYELVI